MKITSSLLCFGRLLSRWGHILENHTTAAEEKMSIFHVVLGVAATLSVLISFLVRPERALICEDEHGFDYVSVSCNDSFFLTRLFYPSYCSLSYEVEGGRSFHSIEEPAKREKSARQFTAADFFTFDPELTAFNEMPPILVRVDFEAYKIEARGGIVEKFTSCRWGDY